MGGQLAHAHPSFGITLNQPISANPYRKRQREGFNSPSVTATPAFIYITLHAEAGALLMVGHEAHFRARSVKSGKLALARAG